MRSLSPVVVALFLAALPASLNAVCRESAKESTCFKIRKTVPLDMDWVMSQKTWYYPLMSRLDLIRVATDIVNKDAKDIQEDELYYDSCMVFKLRGDKFVGTGFHGKERVFPMLPIKGTEVFADLDREENVIGTCYNTFTDNKTFMFAACCSDEGQMAWGVMSPTKTLPKDTVRKIHEHAKSLGFKREYFTGQRYDHCNFGDEQTKSEL